MPPYIGSSTATLEGQGNTQFFNQIPCYKYNLEFLHFVATDYRGRFCFEIFILKESLFYVTFVFLDLGHWAHLFCHLQLTQNIAKWFPADTVVCTWLRQYKKHLKVITKPLGTNRGRQLVMTQILLLYCCVNRLSQPPMQKKSKVSEKNLTFNKLVGSWRQFILLTILAYIFKFTQILSFIDRTVKEIGKHFCKIILLVEGHFDHQKWSI